MLSAKGPRRIPGRSPQIRKRSTLGVAVKLLRGSARGPRSPDPRPGRYDGSPRQASPRGGANDGLAGADTMGVEAGWSLLLTNDDGIDAPGLAALIAAT